MRHRRTAATTWLIAAVAARNDVTIVHCDVIAAGARLIDLP